MIAAVITSVLNNCNFMLANQPCKTIRPLQRVQNVSVRLIFELKPYDHVTPGIIRLHRLPVPQHCTTYRAQCFDVGLLCQCQLLSGSREKLHLLFHLGCLVTTHGQLFFAGHRYGTYTLF